MSLQWPKTLGLQEPYASCAGVIESHEHTMVLLTGRLPKITDTIHWQDWTFEIVAA